MELDAAVELAFMRTELASDRTLLAWVRTALTLMAAGIAYDKGFRLLHDERLAAGTAWCEAPTLPASWLWRQAQCCWHCDHAHVRIVARWPLLDVMASVRAVPALLAAVLVLLLGCAVVVFLLATGKKQFSQSTHAAAFGCIDRKKSSTPCTAPYIDDGL